LDAVHYLGLAKSHFVPQDKMAIRSGQDFFRIEGRFKEKVDEVKVVIKYSQKSKKLEFNDVVTSRIADHIGRIGLVMIAPDDLDIIDGLSALRRKYMDITLIQSDHEYLVQLTTYKKLLDQRNAYLKQVASPDLLYLQAICEKMEGPAGSIFASRKAFTEQFIPYFNKYYAAISGDKEKVDIQFESDLAVDTLSNLFRASITQDIRTQYTNKGCHKDDLKFLINHDQEIKYVASQGQKKTFLVSLFLAQAEFMSGTMTAPPLVLLDDIFDKLDPHRVKYLMHTLKKISNAQIIMTDTNQDRIKPIIRELEIDGLFIDIEKISSPATK
jgi:DNA replication and repair protein RecF